MNQRQKKARRLAMKHWKRQTAELTPEQKHTLQNLIGLRQMVLLKPGGDDYELVK